MERKTLKSIFPSKTRLFLGEASHPEVSQQTTRYLRGPGIDNLLAIESASGTNWVLQDHLGSTRALISFASVLVQSIDYDSFGKAIVAGTPSTRYLYTGRELDAESGLLYYRARYYDSSTGRFTNEDPIGFEGGSWNIQIYVDNSPIFFKDPFGTVTVTVAAEVGGGIWYVCRSNPALCRTAAQGIIQAISTPDPGVCESDPTLFEEHTKGKRPSTKGRHQSGASRRGRGGGGEKGDEKRRPPRTPPDDHKGPWPRKS